MPVSAPDKVIMLPVMESFYTIQGEGIQSGRASWFIRLGGCNVGCVWCDVKESWDVNAHPLVTIDELVEDALLNPSRFCVITGGEPFMHDLNELTSRLKYHGFETAVETSGAYPLSGYWDWICVSPKKFKSPLPENLKVADELKVVIYHPSDFQWAEENAAMTSEKCNLLLQPEYSRFDINIGMIIDYVKQNPKWRISLQTHKIINVP